MLPASQSKVHIDPSASFPQHPPMCANSTKPSKMQDAFQKVYENTRANISMCASNGKDAEEEEEEEDKEENAPCDRSQAAIHLGNLT